MAIFNIPQFIDTEDKIAGPLTAKQLGWIIAACAADFVVYLFFGKTAAFIGAVPIIMIFGAFAFYKPNGQPLTTVAGSLVYFFLHPKFYAWKRLPDEMLSKKKASEKSEDKPEPKVVTMEKIEEISTLLNSPRRESNRLTDGNITFK
jgi:hypothetical protein